MAYPPGARHGFSSSAGLPQAPSQLCIRCRQILEDLGGAPGKLNVTWNKDVPEFPVAYPESLPLADTDNTTFWVYDYR